jgi:hypothetical protein
VVVLALDCSRRKRNEYVEAKVVCNETDTL